MKLGSVESATFADSQTTPFQRAVRGSDEFVIQSICDPSTTTSCSS